jgi:lipopolysaccharide/colanic/teichoic acid biosynthesis glycosyltransferase
VQRTVSIVFPLGTILLVLGIGLAHGVLSEVPYSIGTGRTLLYYLLFAGLHTGVALIAGIPDETDDVQPALAAALLSAGIATALWLVAQTLFPALLPRRVILSSAGFVSAWSFLCALVVLRSLRMGTLRERVVAVVDDDSALVLQKDADRSFPQAEAGFALMACIQVNQATDVRKAQLSAALEDHQPAVLVLSESATNLSELVDRATELHREGVRVRTLGDFYEEYFGKVSLSELSKMAMLFDVRTLHHATYRRMKRLGDVAGAFVGLGLVAGLVLPIWVANFFGNRGPLFFKQQRVGRNGEEFKIVKFRTMQSIGSDDNGAWAVADDPRITPVGGFLRRSHIDELPQMWNVICGELSLVGPRPEQPRYVAELSIIEPAYQLRHLVTPGITGWAQIKLQYAANEEDSIEKLQYDLFYLRHQTFTMDLRIISRTVRSVLRGRGR